MIDSFGRVVRDLRVSVTDRCNFRCLYCMPEDGLPWLGAGDILTMEELIRALRVAIELDVRTVRITGGEPTLRRDRFKQGSRRDGLERVLRGIDASLAAGVAAVNINAVVVRGFNDDEV